MIHLGGRGKLLDMNASQVMSDKVSVRLKRWETIQGLNCSSINYFSKRRAHRLRYSQHANVSRVILLSVEIVLPRLKSSGNLRLGNHSGTLGPAPICPTKTGSWCCSITCLGPQGGGGGGGTLKVCLVCLAWLVVWFWPLDFKLEVRPLFKSNALGCFWAYWGYP